MVCIYCGGKTAVTNSRHNKKQNKVWRRRQCLACQAVFSTYEAADYEKSWVVQSAGGLQPFLRDKLFISIYKSCQHRPTATTDAIGLTDTVISLLRAHGKAGAIDTAVIAHAVHGVLEKFDSAAATHYAAFHAKIMNA